MKYRFILGFVACLLGSAAQAELKLEEPDFNLPDLGSTANATLSTTTETALGMKQARELRGSRQIIEDPELVQWIQTLGQKLSSRAGGGRFYFLIEKNPDINAYAMAGGVVVIHSGLITSTESESELAAVLAHEISHVTQRHIARMMANGKQTPLIAGLGALAGAAAASKSPEAAQAIITGTMAAQAQQQLSFSQQAESEADRVGLKLLANSGFNPQAMPYFLEKLDRHTIDTNGDLTKYLRTHPLSIDRLSDTRSRARQMGAGYAQDDNAYVYAREKLRVLTQPAAQRKGDAIAQNYAQALHLIQGNNARAALPLLASISTPAGTLAKAKALNSMGQFAETEQLLRGLANSQPNNEAAVQLMTEALLATNQAPAAWQLINRTRLNEQTSLEFLETRQRAAEQAGQTAEAYLTAAERSIRMAEYTHARAALNQASRLAGMNATNMARFQALENEVRYTETQSKRLDNL